MPREKKTKTIYLGKSIRVLLSTCNEANVFPPILTEILKLINRNNKIYLNSHLKKQILKNINKDPNENKKYLDVYLDRFVKQNYMLKIAESTYFINPFIFVRGTNLEALKLQDNYSDILTAIKLNKKKSKQAIYKEIEEKCNVFNINEQKQNYGA